MGIRETVRLDGRVAVVTGAGSGLGRAMAQAMARAGAKVAFLDIDLAAADMSATAVRGGGGEVIPLAADITRGRDCERAVAAAVKAFGGLHILVNCAARGNFHVMQSPRTKSMRFWEADPEMWTKVIDTNVNGHYLMAHYATPPMIAAGWGRIVNITTSLPTKRPPVTPSDRSDASHSIGGTMTSGCSSRPARRSRLVGSRNGVSTAPPGIRELQVTPVPSRSLAQTRVAPSIATLLTL